MAIIIRPSGSVNLSEAQVVEESSLPQTITDIAGGDWEVGRVAWGDVVTVTEAPVIKGDIPWTNVTPYVAMQFTSAGLTGGDEGGLEFDVIQGDVPFGSANVWGGHRTIQEDGVTHDWTNWNLSTQVLLEHNMPVMTAISPGWPRISNGYTPTAADWKQAFDAYYDGVLAQPRSDTIKFVRCMNETVHPQDEAEGVSKQVWYPAADADPDWAAAGLPARMWWTYSAASAGLRFPNGKIFVNDYYPGVIDGSAQAWGDADYQPETLDPVDFNDQRFYLLIQQLHEALLLAEDTGAGGVAAPGALLDGLRIDGVGIQSHYRPVHGIALDGMRWQLDEYAGALDLDIYATEINSKIRDAGNFTGILAGSPEMDEFASQVALVRLHTLLSHVPHDRTMFTFWTEFTDEGSDQAITLYRAGKRTVLYDKMRDLFTNPPAPIVRRAAMTNFHGPGPGVLPVQILNGDMAQAKSDGALTTTNIQTGSKSDHPTNGLYLRHSRYRKRVAGVMSDFDPQNRTVVTGFVRGSNDAANLGFRPYIEYDAVGTELLRLEMDGQDNLFIHVNGGAGTLVGELDNGGRAQVTIRYDGTGFEVAFGYWKDGVHRAPSSVSMAGTIGDVALYEFVRPSGGSDTRVSYHGLIDGDDGPATTADLLELAPVRLGTIMSQAEISAFTVT